MMRQTVEHAYGVTSHGGSGKYTHEDFLGIAFTWDEVKAMIDKNRNHPCPGERWEITRRKIGAEGSQHLTVWKYDRWEHVDEKRWHR